jgi:uncharacterized repeat protein (TIGR01451 family)
MTRTHNCRLRWQGRKLTTLAVAAPLFALSWHHLAVQSHAAMEAARPAAAHRVLTADPATARSARLLSRAVNRGRHRGHASTSPSPAAVTPRPANAAAPALSISVTDGRRTVQPGDLITYTIKIRNIGVTNAPGLKIVQTLPPGMKLISATGHAGSRPGQLTWQVSLRARHTDTFQVVGRVGKTPKQLLRLATVACASGRHSDTPIVCATRSDELPAGAMVAAHASHPTPPAGAGSHAGYLSVAIALALITAGACGWLLLRRYPRRRS